MVRSFYFAGEPLQAKIISDFKSALFTSGNILSNKMLANRNANTETVATCLKLIKERFKQATYDYGYRARPVLRNVLASGAPFPWIGEKIYEAHDENLELRVRQQQSKTYLELDNGETNLVFCDHEGLVKVEQFKGTFDDISALAEQAFTVLAEKGAVSRFYPVRKMGRPTSVFSAPHTSSQRVRKFEAV